MTLAGKDSFAEALEAAHILMGQDRGQLAAFLGVSPQTIARRKRAGRWRQAERLRLEMAYRLAREAGRRLGGPLRGAAWLTSPSQALSGLTPLDLLDSLEGYERARDVLVQTVRPRLEAAGVSEAEGAERAAEAGAGAAGSLAVLDELAARLGIPARQLAAAVGLGERALRRRGRAGRLEPAEAAALERAGRLFGRCAEVLGLPAARGWFTRPKRLLGGQTPLNLCSSAAGATEVARLLDEIDLGTCT